MTKNIWEQMLRQLDTLRPDTAEWTVALQAIRRATEMVIQKLDQERELLESGEKALQHFRCESKWAIEFFEFSDVNAWSTDACPAAKIPALTDLLTTCETLCAEYRSRSSRQPATLSETHAMRRELVALESRIRTLHDSLASEFASPRPKGVATRLDTSSGVDESVTAAVSARKSPQPYRTESHEPHPRRKNKLKEILDEIEKEDLRVSLLQKLCGPDEPRQPVTAKETLNGDAADGSGPDCAKSDGGEAAVSIGTSPAVEGNGTRIKATGTESQSKDDKRDSAEPALPFERFSDEPVETSLDVQDDIGAEVSAADATSSTLGSLESGTDSLLIDDGPDVELPPVDPKSVAFPVYTSSMQTTAQQIASEALRPKTEGRMTLLSDLIWRLAADNRKGIAYQLANYLERSNCRTSPFLPAWLIRACILGGEIRNATSEKTGLLQEDFTNFTEGVFLPGNDEWNLGVRLLLASAALRPALLAPITGASGVLHALRSHEKLPRFYEFCRRIASFADYGQPLDPRTLKNVRTHAAWQNDLASLYSEVDEWWFRSPTMTMAYAAATNVWREWLREDQLIHAIVTPIRQKDVSAKRLVQQRILHLSRPVGIEREVQRTNRRLRRGKSLDIIATALGQLQSRVQEATSYAQRWINLLNSDPTADQGFLKRHVDELQRDLSPLHDALLEELATISQQSDYTIASFAIKPCCEAVQDIRDLFDPETPFHVNERAICELINGELLKVGGIPLDTAWNPETTDYEQLLGEILAYLAEEGRDWQTAFDRYSNARDHRGTEQIVSLLESREDSDLVTDFLRTRRKQRLEECRDSLRRDIAETRKKVEEAVSFGLLREEERTDLAARVEVVESELDEILRFQSSHLELAVIREQVASKREASVNAIRRRMSEANIGENHPAYERINAAIQGDDVFTANEHIDMALRGHELTASEPHRDILEEFLNSYQRIAAYLEKDGPMRSRGDQQVIADLRARRSLGPISLKQIPGAQTKEAENMAKAWFTAKRTMRIDENLAGKVLAGLGFSGVQIEVQSSTGGCWLNVRTQPIRDRNICPLPLFGSLANGKYRVLCVWGRPTEEDVINEVGAGGSGPPVLVFYFGRLTQQRRRDLAVYCRQRRRSFVVVDDMLLIFLCGERGSRLPVLFECCLPFTFQEPYTTTAGLVPPEVFVGRERNGESISDPMGTCFLYGGRQLGKTALLRHVEHECNDLKQGRLAVWLDLKTEGIGSGRTVDEIWTLLATRLKRLKVLSERTPAHTSPQRLLQYVESWLLDDDGRRILLLLDEADRFLESDGKPTDGIPFSRVEMLKGLMDRTNRRFKVIFAGLHDVQRTIRQVNQPLAPGHFGDPICIGPLIDNGEWREARALIERPMNSMGYRFETPDLVTRILSQTNYYPSLIQLYCSHLLRHIQGPHADAFDPRTSPPYIVTARHIDEAYHSEELRQAIRDRFNLTLNLDRRYRVIALIIAFYSQNVSSEASRERFSVPWIREQALTFWPSGFRTAGAEPAFRILLDEMVGLGILRKAKENSYALRSPNVALLIGTRERVEEELESCSGWPDPPDYNPAVFRAAFHHDDEKVDVTHRSPFTADQESELRARVNGIAIVFGCEVSGLGNAGRFLRAACGPEFYLEFGDLGEDGEWLKLLDDLPNRERDGATVIYVGAEQPWNLEWVKKARERVKRLTSSRSYLHFVFAADPAKTWKLVSHWGPDLDRVFASGITKMSLGTWHEAMVRQWLDDCAFGAELQENWKAVCDVTGSWPLLLERFLERAGGDRDNWRNAVADMEAYLKNPTGQLLDQFGMNVPDSGVLSEWAALKTINTQDFAELLEVPEESIQQLVRWADFLSLAAFVGNEECSLDPLAAQILTARTV